MWIRRLRKSPRYLLDILPGKVTVSAHLRKTSTNIAQTNVKLLAPEIPCTQTPLPTRRRPSPGRARAGQVSGVEGAQGAGRGPAGARVARAGVGLRFWGPASDLQPSLVGFRFVVRRLRSIASSSRSRGDIPSR